MYKYITLIKAINYPQGEHLTSFDSAQQKFNGDGLQ